MKRFVTLCLGIVALVASCQPCQAFTFSVRLFDHVNRNRVVVVPTFRQEVAFHSSGYNGSLFAPSYQGGLCQSGANQNLFGPLATGCGASANFGYGANFDPNLFGSLAVEHQSALAERLLLGHANYNDLAFLSLDQRLALGRLSYGDRVFFGNHLRARAFVPTFHGEIRLR